MEKCYYCGKPDVLNVIQVIQVHSGFGNGQTALPYCCDYCKEQLIKYAEYAKKYAGKLTYLYRGFFYIIILLILIRIIIQYDNIFLSYVMFITLVGAGVTAFIFPFVKLSECLFLGVKRTNNFVRVLGGALIIWAALIIFKLYS